MFFTPQQFLESLNEENLLLQPITHIRQLSDATKVLTQFQIPSDELKTKACAIWNASIRKEIEAGVDGNLFSAELKKLSFSLFQISCSTSLQDKMHLLLIAAKTARCLILVSPPVFLDSPNF